MINNEVRQSKIICSHKGNKSYQEHRTAQEKDHLNAHASVSPSQPCGFS